MPGYRGIPEPTGELVSPGAGDVLVVPVLGFDSEMSRMGQGKGHYDALIARLLLEQPGIPIVGLAFLIQQVDRLPMEPHDQRLDAIATEAGVWEY
jgi:5-formyltetrahydrofolate cyclo-ligase